ncbi:hypothetical protein ACJRO7_017393 [Eucalyptus globulus]|uniref:Uncharacterized protein n=1 Tax=Eucalyptus globulus TaxID=34317 RepID=A0ABD3KWH3_EUCGL
MIESHVLKGFAMVSLQDSINIIGGRLCYKEMVHASDELAELVDVEVKVLSTVIDFACMVCDNKIYVTGDQSTSFSAKGIPSAEVYDLKCAVVTWNSKVQVIGGYNERLDSGHTIPFIVEHGSVDVYNPKMGRWELMATMWQLDVPPSQILALDDGRLFTSGDRRRSWKGYIIAHDPELNMWDTVPGSLQETVFSGGHPSQPTYVADTPIGTRLYFLVGYWASRDLPRTVSMAHVFDMSPNAECWRSFEPAKEDGERVL